MKLADYAEFSGIEIANAQRTQAYIRNGLAGAGFYAKECDCSPMDTDTFLSPATDPAPWYTTERAESAQFLGLRTTRITIDPVAFRSVVPRFDQGASVGKLRARARVVAFEGIMLATTDLAMAYGERWLSQILAGVVYGCAPDTIRLLLACDTTAFRSLRRVGIVDGPTFTPIGQTAPECVIQRVTFQLVAGVPYLLTDPSTCLAETVLAEGS